MIVSLDRYRACQDTECSGTDGGGPDAGGGDGDSGPTMVVFSGLVKNLDDSPVPDATLTFPEAPDITTTSALDGSFTVQVPTETPLTPHFVAKGQVPSVAQTFIVHSAWSGRSFRMATPSQYVQIAASASAPNGTGIMRVDVTITASCSLVGGHFGTTPASGTVVYAGADQLPNASYTAFQPMAPGAYVIGATGTLTPFIKDVKSPCAPVAWPVDIGSVTVLGPVTIEPNAYHDVGMNVK
jgi:hypothetical protein